MTLSKKQLQKIREEVDPNVNYIENETRVLLFNLMVDVVKERVEGFSHLFYKVYPEIVKSYFPDIKKRYFHDFDSMINWMKRTKDFLTKEKVQRTLATKILLAQLNEKYPKARFKADDRGNITVIEPPCPRVSSRIILCNGIISFHANGIELKGYSAPNFKMAVEEFEQMIKTDLKIDSESDSPCTADLASCHMIGFR